MAAGERGGYVFNSSLPLPPASKTLISCTITAESSPLHIARQPDSNWEPQFSERKLIITKLRAPSNGSFKDNIFNRDVMCSSLVSSCSSSETATGGVLKKIPQNSQENTCSGDSFLAFLFVPCGEIWLGQIHQLTSAGRLL